MKRNVFGYNQNDWSDLEEIKGDGAISVIVRFLNGESSLRNDVISK